MPVYCITGTNRGLGLEFVRQLAKSADNTILATTRSLPSSDLGDLRAVASPSTHIFECDTGNVESIRDFVKEAASVLGPEKEVDYLINNAGVNSASWQSSLTLDPEALALQISINVLGPAKVVEFLLGAKLLSTDVRILNMTSGLGSLQRAFEFKPRKAAGYSISKAALNMLSIHQSEDLKTELPGVVVIVVDPGWVKTRMGGAGALTEPHDSIEGMLEILHELKEEDNGKFFHASGELVPW